MPNFVENVPCCYVGLLLSFAWFCDGTNWPPKLCTKFEVDTFSHCINIKGKTPIFGSSPSLGRRPFFFLVGFYDGLWQTPSACQFWSRIAGCFDTIRHRKKVRENRHWKIESSITLRRYRDVVIQNHVMICQIAYQVCVHAVQVSTPGYLVALLTWHCLASQPWPLQGQAAWVLERLA